MALNLHLIVQFFLLGIISQSQVHGTFNLYLNVEEVKRLLGLSKELYYVREGVVNEYALNFVVPVPAHVNALHFTWETLGPKPLPYSVAIDTSDSLALEKPTFNISSKGSIPTEPQTFRVSLPCTGVRSAEVNVELTLNVTAYPKFRANDVTTIVFRRKKICLQDSKPKLPQVSRGSKQGNANGSQHQNINSSKLNSHFQDSSNNLSQDSSSVVMISAEEAVTDKNNVIYIVVGCSFGLVVILVALASAAYVRTRKGNSTAESNGFLHVDTSGHGSSSSGCGSGSRTGTGSLFVRPESPHHYSSVSPCLDGPSGIYTYSSFLPNNTHYSEIAQCPIGSASSSNSSRGCDTTTSSCKLADMTIERCKVRLQSVIMEGTFAKVYKGTVMERDGSEDKVIVKTVNDHSSPVQMALLLHEGLALVGIVHKHVYSVIGVAAEERVPPFLIYPDDGLRNLKRFLQRCRTGRTITTQEIVHMSIHVGNGLSFLHRQNLIHRDVASRNCVVDDKLVVKICDGALSRDLFPDDYHWAGDSECRPIKWLSPETILHHRNSTAGDVWSFGVLLWELSTLATQPYAEIDHGDLISFLKMGYRLSQPLNCPDELYSSMTRCWTWESDDRPKWTHVLPELQSLHAQLAQYV